MFHTSPQRIPAGTINQRVSPENEAFPPTLASISIADRDYGTIWFLEVDPETGTEWLSKEMGIDRGQVLRKAAVAGMKSLGFYGPGYGENDWLWDPNARPFSQTDENRKPLNWRLHNRNVHIPGTDTLLYGDEDEDDLFDEEEEGTFDQIKPYTSPVTF